MPMKSRREQKNYAFVDQCRNRGPKFLFLGINLLTGVGFDLLRRYAKSWTASLKEEIRVRREDSKPRISGESKSETTIAPLKVRQEKERGKPQRSTSYAARVLNLLKSTAQEWSQDRCPQLGAALAYYTVFSLAPLMLVLLAVFGLIYGGSEQAREKILDQLRYLIDPSGLKVIQDIANNAAQPKAGILAAAIGIVIALFGASGIFGQLQDALNTIWGVKPKPGQGIWGFIRARFLSFAMVGGVCFLLLVSLTVENLLRGLHKLSSKHSSWWPLFGTGGLLCIRHGRNRVAVCDDIPIFAGRENRLARRVDGSRFDGDSFRDRQISARSVLGQRGSWFGLWGRKLASNTATLGLLFCPDPALRRRIHPGLC